MASLKAIIVTTLVMLVPFVPVTAVAVTNAGPGLMRHEEEEVEVEGAEPSMVQTEAHECSVNDETNCCFTAEGVDFTGNHKDRIPEGVSIYVGMCAYGASAAAPELWEHLAPLLKTCDTDACTRVAPQVPADKKCKDYKCPAGFNGHTPGSDDRPCENAALCDFNCCEVDINSDKRRRNGYLTFGVIMALKNVSVIANEVAQRKNPNSQSKGPQSDVSELLDNAAGLYHVMHRVMGKEKANDLCKDGDFSSFRACLHSTMCVIEKYTHSNPEADNEEIKTYTLMVELYEDFKTLTWERLNVDLLSEGADESLGNFEFVPQSELTGGCDGFTGFLGALKSAGLLETDIEESSEVAAAVRVSKSLINAAKTSHAVLDAHATNSSADGTVTALHQAWSEPCKLMLCDHTNYYDMLGASYTHSLALLNMGVSADHMKVHTATRSMLEKRMQKFLVGHGSTFADRFIKTEGTFTEARLSQYSDALLNAVKATLVKVPLTYGVDAMLLSMVARSEMQKFAVTPLQENALRALQSDNLVAYADANKLREKMNLPPSSMDTEEDLDWEEPPEDLLDITRRASEGYSHHKNLDISLERKGPVKALMKATTAAANWVGNAANDIADVAVDVGNTVANTVVAVGKGIAKVGETIANGVVAGFTAMSEAIVTVAKGIYAGVKAFVDFIVSLISCFGAGAVAKVGYLADNAPPTLYIAPKPATVALTIAIAVLGGLTNILKKKQVDTGVGIELSVVAGFCPSMKRAASLRLGFGAGVSVACTVEKGCLLTVSVGAVASAGLPKKRHPRCIAGRDFYNFECMQTFGIVIKLFCCEVSLLPPFCQTCKGGGCDGWKSKGTQDQQNQGKQVIDSGGANVPVCVETISGKGSSYEGCQTETLSGRICQKWSIQYPHTHGWINGNGAFQTWGSAAPTGLGDHNFCRNPDNGATIWCYTMDATKRWEVCQALPQHRIMVGQATPKTAYCVGDAHGPHRYRVSQGSNCGNSGWTHKFAFNAYSTQNSGTTAYCVGDAHGPHRYRVSQGSNCGNHGWTHKLTFNAYSTQKSGTTAYCVGYAYGPFRYRVSQGSNCGTSGWTHSLTFYA